MIVFCSALKHIETVVPYLCGLKLSYIDEDMRYSKLPFMWRHGINYKVCEDKSRLKTLLKTLNPSIVVVDEDVNPYRKTLVLVARELGIPSLQIMHGVFMLKAGNGLFPVASDYVAIGGEAMREIYLRKGVEHSKIKMLGIPHLDKLASMSIKATRTVLYCDTVGTDAGRSRNIQIMLTDFVLNKEVKLIYKAHPLDPEPNKFRYMLSGIPHRFIHHGNTMKLIAEAGTVISPPSNIIIQALLLHKHTVLMNHMNIEPVVPIFAEGINQLKPLSKRQWLINEWLGGLGNGGQRVATFIRHGINGWWA